MNTAQPFEFRSLENETKLEEKITQEVNVDSLYDKAKDECILSDRKSEKQLISMRTQVRPGLLPNFQRIKRKFGGWGKIKTLNIHG